MWHLENALICFSIPLSHRIEVLLFVFVFALLRHHAENKPKGSSSTDFIAGFTYRALPRLPRKLQDKMSSLCSQGILVGSVSWSFGDDKMLLHSLSAAFPIPAHCTGHVPTLVQSQWPQCLPIDYLPSSAHPRLLLEPHPAALCVLPL